MRNTSSLKILALICVINFSISACITKNIGQQNYINKTSVSLSINSKSNLIYVKKTDLFNSCITDEFRGNGDTNEYFLGVSCTFKNSIPDVVELQYLVGLSDKESTRKYFGKRVMESKKINGVETRFHFFDIKGNKLSETEWINKGLENRNRAIMAFPQSAWKSYKIDLKSIINKYKNIKPQGKPMLGVVPIGRGVVLDSPFSNLHNRHLNLEVLIDEQGNVTLKEHYTWEHPVSDNPYA